jgi:hypothetical protein
MGRGRTLRACCIYEYSARESCVAALLEYLIELLLLLRNQVEGRKVGLSMVTLELASSIL